MLQKQGKKAVRTRIFISSINLRSSSTYCENEGMEAVAVRDAFAAHFSETYRTVRIFEAQLQQKARKTRGAVLTRGK